MRAWSVTAMPVMLGAMSESTRSALRPVERRLDRRQARARGEVALDEGHARDGLHLQQVDRDHAAPGSHALRQHLGPAAGRRAQVHDHEAAP